MKQAKRRRAWVGLVSVLLILPLIFAGCGEAEKEPTVTGVSPSSGKVGVTISVTITGTHLTDASAVSFGAGITVNSFTVDSKTEITASITIDATAATGSRAVSVTTPEGTGTKTGGFTVSALEAPTVTGVSPDYGEQGETLAVTITGTNFSDASAVSFGADITVDNFTADSATQISANITIGEEATTGSRDVSVTNPDGPGTLAGGYTVGPLPPIKIGALFPLSGYLSSAGGEGLEGVKMYLDEIGWEVEHREIQLISEDTEAQGGVGLEKAIKLVEHDNVDVLTGIVSSGVAIALRSYVTEQEVPLILGMSGSTTLCFNMPSDYIVNVGHINGDHTYSGVEYAYDTLGYRNAIMMYSNYAAGQEFAMVFKNMWQELTGTIVDEIPTPPGTTDFAPHLTGLPEADFVWAFYSDREAMAFVNQYHDFGLEMPIIGAQGGMTTPAAVEGMGDNAIGLYVGSHTPPFGALPGRPATEAFATAFEARHGAPAGPMAYTGYQQAYCIVKAVEAVDGDIEDALAFVDAMTDLEFEGLASPVRFEKDYNWVSSNVYFFQVVEEDGEPAFEILATYEDIGPSDLLAYID